MNPYHHALSSVQKWGGGVPDYLPIHNWFDASKAFHADFRHRAMRHHAEGIFLMESLFGPVLILSTCKRCGLTVRKHDGAPNALGLASHSHEAKVIPTRWVGEQHVTEDLGRIPDVTEWLKAIAYEPWMNAVKVTSRDIERREEEQRHGPSPAQTV